MKVTMLGGGNEVGASCLHVELNGVKILIDAGIRTHSHDMLPSFGKLDDLGGINIILLTHAHSDHIGALPYLARLYPDVPIYASPPTIELLQVMLLDSYSVMKDVYLENNWLLPYSEKDLDDCIKNILPFAINTTLSFENIKINSYNAGHILGSCMYALYSNTLEERLFVTGDFSGNRSRLLPPLKVPYGLSPTAMITETTFGHKKHNDILADEDNLSTEVADTLSKGGQVLIPSFALGRAQEIILILKHYMKIGTIPKYPIYVDGMIKEICDIHSRNAEYLNPSLKNQPNIFFDDNCIKVTSEKHREQIISSGPCCIISSSGSLSGGPSASYARMMVQNPYNAIFLTGNLDDTSSGKSKIIFSGNSKKNILIGKEKYSIKCQIKYFNLFDHADKNTIVRLIESLQPKTIFLVHGSEKSQDSIFNTFPNRSIKMINNNTYEVLPDWTSNTSIKDNSSLAKSVDKSASIGDICLLRYENKEFLPAMCIGQQGEKDIFKFLHNGDLMNEDTTRNKVLVGKWLYSYEELKTACDNLKPPLLPWNSLRINQKANLNGICSELRIRSLPGKLTVYAYLYALPAKYRYAIDNREYYIINAESKGILKTTVKEEKYYNTPQLDISKLISFYELPVISYIDFTNSLSLSFISPGVASRYEEEISKLKQDIGKTVKISNDIDSEKILEISKMVLSDVHINQINVVRLSSQVVVDISSILLDSDKDMYSNMIKNLTGMELKIR